MEDFKLDFDILWGGVASCLEDTVKSRISIPKGRTYFSISSEAHKGMITYQTEFRTRDGKASVAIETYGGEEAKAAIEAMIAIAPEDHIIKTAEVKQGVKNKEKWAWPITTPIDGLNIMELVAWYVNTISDLYTFFEGVSAVAEPTVDAVAPKTARKNLVRVEIEIVEHDYAAFDSDDEMLGESFTFNSDESPESVRIYVDGNEIDFDEDDLADRSQYSDYEPFDMEQEWNNDDIVKFGYYDNASCHSWEFEVENFDIEKLSFFYKCFDVSFSPADYDCEEHRISLRYDGVEVEEDFNSYDCDYGDFEQEWYMYDDED